MRLNEVSQSKKIGQYVDASVFIKWYRENKTKIASILKVDENTLPDINEMLSQSYGLIKNVINPQSGGNRGSRTAFQSFQDFDKILIHDFLHNLYDVAEKDFIKSLTDFEFTIDELIEEIEILAIEESFMKYMNIRYPNRDFINQNINQLGSYVVATFIKDYPEDFSKIISGEEEPFLPVQGKKMYLKGTPYEGMAVLMKKIPKSPRDLGSDYNKEFIEDQDDLHEFLRDIYSISRTIDDTGGDRGQFPDGDYFGSNVDDNYYDDDNIEYFIDNAGDDYDFKEADEYYDIIKERIIDYFENEGEEVSEEEIEEYFGGEKEDDNFPGLDFSYDDISRKDEYTRNGKDYYFFNTEDLSPIDANIRDILKSYGDDDYGYYEYLDEKDREYNDEIYSSYYEKTKDISSESLIGNVLNNTTAAALFRRFFRGTDLIRNVSKPTSGEWRSQNANLNLNNFFETPYPSLSKNLYTDNAKKLYILLYEFRGYIITNLNQIKAQYKENKKVNVDNEFFTFLKKDTKMIETFYYSYKTQGNNFNKYINTIKENRYGIEIKRRPDLNTNYYIIGQYIDFLFEFIPFLEKYYEFVKNTDKDYLSTYSANVNINIGTVFSDDFIKKIRQLYIVLQGVFAKTKKIKSLEREIEKSLEEIDLASINKRLNQKYGDNIPDSVYDNVFKIIIDSIFTKYYKKPKRIDKEESKYDSLKKYKNAKKLIDIEDWNTIAKFVVFY